MTTLKSRTPGTSRKGNVGSGRDFLQSDIRAIRNLVDTWMAATKKGDLTTVLSLMSDDVKFMVPGREPFGKRTFAANTRKMGKVLVKGTSRIQEIKVLGDWAWMRNYLTVTVTPPAGKPTLRSGYTLTILRRKADGAWVIARDANLLTS